MAGFTQPSDQYARAMGWSPQDLNQVNQRGLDGLAQQDGPRSRDGGASNEFLSGLLGVLTQFPQAGTQGLGILQGVLQSISAQQQQTQAARDANRAQYRSDLSGLISSNPAITPDQLQGFASSMYPNLSQKPYGQHTLDAFSGLTSTASDAVAPEDIAAMQQSVATLAADGTSTLNDAIVTTTQAARLGGAPEAVIEKMKAYITSLWARTKGWETLDQSPPASYQPAAASPPVSGLSSLQGVAQGRAPIFG